MIKFKNVSKRYSNGHIGLNNVSFSVEHGEFLFITGHSGAGKSTLLRMLLAMEKPTSGKVLLEGNDLTKISAPQIPFLRRQIGLVFQNHQLLFDRNVFQNVALPLQIAGMKQEFIKQQVHQTLRILEIEDKINYMPANLSTGQQQRVGIARAIIHNPPLLLADEPTGNLDPKLAIEIMKIFSAIHQQGKTVIIASHDLALIAKMKYRLLNIQKGKLLTDKKAYD
jgi:cell division transport system ATP-binding protein